MVADPESNPDDRVVALPDMCPALNLTVYYVIRYDANGRPVRPETSQGGQMTAPENSNLESVLADIRELRKTLEFEKEVQSIRADMAKDLSALRKDFSDLKTEVKVESNFYRWVGASSIFVAIILGALGI